MAHDGLGHPGGAELAALGHGRHAAQALDLADGAQGLGAVGAAQPRALDTDGGHDVVAAGQVGREAVEQVVQAMGRHVHEVVVGGAEGQLGRSAASGARWASQRCWAALSRTRLPRNLRVSIKRPVGSLIAIL